jgi:hypothetical protein
LRCLTARGWLLLSLMQNGEVSVYLSAGPRPAKISRHLAYCVQPVWLKRSDGKWIYYHIISRLTGSQTGH